MALFDFDLSIVPDVDFAVKDASLIQSQVIHDYEQYFYLITQINKTLGRADPVRLFLLSIIYQLVNQRVITDYTGKQNLIKYAEDEALDNIGARWGPTRGRRLPAQSATCTLRWTLAIPLTFDAVVPYNCIAQTGSGIQFATVRQVIIPAGQISAEVTANAIQVGERGNGFLAGQVNQIVSTNVPYLTAVTNTDATHSGRERESNDRFRMRIWMAPESFSVAGPYGAYEYWTATANSAITDVSVWSAPEVAGQVFLYFLMENGRLPTDAEREQVLDFVGADDIRPLTDWVKAELPQVVDVNLACTYWIEEEKKLFESQIRLAVETAYDQFLFWQRAEIGRDINPSEAIRMLMNAGSKRVTCARGAANAGNRLTARQLANPSAASVLTYGGLESKSERPELGPPPLEIEET
ncbi:MAG TPA: baseplate J/gp47 family protein [Bacteroidia bacterium]|nr:baseplate J/gp47 family protein [Bacteroidia bacterium]